jgi:hypothetical protein
LHSHLDLGFVARLFDPRRDDHGAVVFGHLLITVVQQRLVTTRTNDPGLEIVGILFPARICARLLGYVGKRVKDSISGYIIFIGL